MACEGVSWLHCLGKAVLPGVIKAVFFMRANDCD